MQLCSVIQCLSNELIVAKFSLHTWQIVLEIAKNVKCDEIFKNQETNSRICWIFVWALRKSPLLIGFSFLCLFFGFTDLFSIFTRSGSIISILIVSVGAAIDLFRWRALDFFESEMKSFWILGNFKFNIHLSTSLSYWLIAPLVPVQFLKFQILISIAIY